VAKLNIVRQHMEYLKKREQIDLQFQEFIELENKRLMLEIGAQIREIRKAFRMTQAEVATRARMSQGHYCNVEKGNAQGLEIKTLIKIAIAFGFELKVTFEPR